MTTTRAGSRLMGMLLAGVSCGLFGLACGGDDESSSSGPKKSVEVTFQHEDELFPGLDYSTGLLPDGSPVKASFTVSAKGASTVSAVASPSGSTSSPTLTGVPKGGALVIDGQFALIGQLQVDISGLPSYDGPIPGIENVQIAVQGKSEFDPFAIEAPVSVRADIPATKLPGIPLPGGIPGTLVLEVAEGSFTELGFAGECAGVDGDVGSYTGRIEHLGTLVIKPSIEIEVPIIGTKTFEIPEFTVDLTLGGSEIAMNADIEAYGAKPKGDHRSGGCAGGGTAGVGGAGGAATSSSSGPGTGGSGPSSTASSATGGVSTCDDKADCQACEACAGEGSCADEVDACVNDSACSAMIDCIDPCLDEACLQACWDANPNGQSLYDAALVCLICDECPISCDAAASGC